MRIVKNLVLLLLLGIVLFIVAATIGAARVAQPSLTLEEVQQSLVVEQGAAILSLYCHQRPAVADDNDVEPIFIVPTASKLKLQ